MAFFILFSALSSQWVGAMTFQNSHSHQMSAVDQNSQSIQKEPMASHDGCPSMKAEVKEVASDCASCGDDCQCDSFVCHSSTSPLASLSNHGFHSPALSMMSVAFIQANLPNVPAAQEIRPPKFL